MVSTLVWWKVLGGGVLGAALIEILKLASHLRTKKRPPVSWTSYTIASVLLVCAGGGVAFLHTGEVASFLIAAHLGASAPALAGALFTGLAFDLHLDRGLSDEPASGAVPQHQPVDSNSLASKGTKKKIHDPQENSVDIALDELMGMEDDRNHKGLGTVERTPFSPPSPAVIPSGAPDEEHKYREQEERKHRIKLDSENQARLAGHEKQLQKEQELKRIKASKAFPFADTMRSCKNYLVNILSW